MKTLFAACAGLLMIGAVGASSLSAQGVNVRVVNNNRSVEVNTNRGGANVRITRNQPQPRAQAGHYVTVKTKVFVPGHFKTISERVWIPERHETVIERVYVPGGYETVRERRVDHRGNAYYVNVQKWVPGHYHNVEKCVVIPGRFEMREKRVWVEGCYEIREERKWVPGHQHHVHRHR